MSPKANAALIDGMAAACEARLKRQESKGRLAYEDDVTKRPTYHDGTPRQTWEELCQVARWSWIRTPRDFSTDQH